MSLLARLSAAALTTVLTTTAAVTVGSAAEASSAAPAQSTSVSSARHASLDLSSDTVQPRRDGRAAKVRKWKVRTLYYYETLPAKWDWSLSTAAGKWNASGGRIRLVRTVVPRKAQVRIGYAAIGGAAGNATVGATRNAFVHLSSRYRTADAVNARTRVTVMNVFAHELGHVLGFQHTSARCSLMAPTLDVGGCNLVPASQPGHYKCRTIDTRLERRFITRYGGRARYPSATWCVIDPLPPALAGVTFTDGLASPVALHWTRPSSVPSGSSIVVKRWEATACGTAPSWATTFRPAMATGLWQDQATTQAQDACFQIQLVNRYGAGRAARARLLSRWVTPLDAPVIGVPSYDFDADQFSFTAAVPDGSTLRARWDSDHPSTCVISPSGGTNSAFVDVVDGHGTLELSGSLPQCVAFFAHDQDTQRYSDPVFVTFTEPNWPNPDAPVVGTPTYDRVAAQFTTPVTVRGGTELVARWNSVSPSTCVTSITAGSAQTISYTDGVATIAQTGTFPRCVSFFSVDGQHNRNSTAASVTLSIPAPAAPTIGEVTWDAAAGKFHAPAGLPAGTHLAYNMSNTRGVCPGSFAGASNVTVSNGIADFQTLYPDQCLTFYAVDNRSGAGSAPTQVTVNAASLPTETPTMGPISVLYGYFYPWFETELGGAAAGNKIGYQVLPGSCPTTAPTVTQWRTQLQGDPGIGSPTDPHAAYGLFPSAAAGVNCLVATSLDWFGWSGGRADGFLTDRHGPVVMTEFVDDGPPPPMVGTASWDSASGTFQVELSNGWHVKAIYDPSDPTTCPSPVAPGAQPVTSMTLTNRLITLTPPTPHTCVTLYRDAGEGPVPVGAGTPVQLDVP